MITGFPPYHLDDPKKNPVELYEKITRGTDYINWPDHISPLARDVITHLMDPDPSKRYGNMIHGPRDFFNHPFFAEVDWAMLAGKQLSSPFVPEVSWAGDSRAFDVYDEDPAVFDYGMFTPDPHGTLFPGFEYTADRQGQDPMAEMLEAYQQLAAGVDQIALQNTQQQQQYYPYPTHF